MQKLGSPYALGNFLAGQPFYDDLVDHVNCSHHLDTLYCLRKASYEQIQAWVNSTPKFFGYESINLVWQPRIDEDIFIQNPQRSMIMGRYAMVPLLTGDCDDEGTLFSTGNTNITYVP
ncbi:hypothetical protein WOLCODRAFT_20391 [Wolfiporia cocos MD-104 SS10]|uniref:Carboxylesterase type B domain-containing protein n=1 Tax=Wolfiporia cocos (strain MD-104) TaxID=742152 RepID=A0A2H3JBQ9_WOLCO|nr:hypothetical protein WOLCODRAFT_20391 [Wolfiporia cocos MD-104 SS10]